MTSLTHRLLVSLAPRLPAGWWSAEGQLTPDLLDPQRGIDRDRFVIMFASATRKLGKQPLLASNGGGPPMAGVSDGERPQTTTGNGASASADAQAARLAHGELSWLIPGAGLDELARVGLLVGAETKLSPHEMTALVDDCFRRGDSHERRAVLRSLPLLADPKRYDGLAAQACRSSVQTVFEAICCENPYPATHFSDLYFNQMVLKALFNEVPTQRILGLRERTTPDLARMAKNYASERHAAGRSIPHDVARLADEAAGPSA